MRAAQAMTIFIGVNVIIAAHPFCVAFVYNWFKMRVSPQLENKRNTIKTKRTPSMFWRSVLMSKPIAIVYLDTDNVDIYTRSLYGTKGGVVIHTIYSLLIVSFFKYFHNSKCALINTRINCFGVFFAIYQGKWWLFRFNGLKKKE